MTVHQLAKLNPLPLIQAVEALETCGGDLDTFIANHKAPQASPGQMLFWFELELSKPVNVALKERWQNALKLSAKIRFDLLRCRAFDMLESYQNPSATSAATDIAYCKTILTSVLVEENESVKSRYRVNREDNMQRESDNREGDSMRELEQEFEEVENA